VCTDGLDSNYEHLLSLIGSDYQGEVTNTFLAEFYYFLPYIKKSLDFDTNNNNVFGSYQSNREMQEDFEIEARSTNAANCTLGVDLKRLGGLVKSLLKQVELDFLVGQLLDEQTATVPSIRDR
jgi:hypothetical protein